MMMVNIALLSAATTTSTGAGRKMPAAPGSVQASVAGTGAVSATVVVEVANIVDQWLTLGTITLSGTTKATDGFGYGAPWDLIRCRLTSISGSGATVDCSIAA